MPGSTPVWPYRFSRRAVTARRSLMRELMPLTSRPDIISFAGGLPAPDLFPVEDYQICLDHVLTTEGRRALQYGPIYPPLKEALVHLMKLRGVEAAPSDIFITNGAQQGLSVVGQLLLNPNSPVILVDPVPGDPHDPVTAVDDERHPIALVARHLAVYEVVLQLLPPAQPEWSQPVAPPAGPHRQIGRPGGVHDCLRGAPHEARDALQTTPGLP